MCPWVKVTVKPHFQQRKEMVVPKRNPNKSQKIPMGSCVFESALSSPDGNVSRVLRGGMPKLTGAEEMAKAE